MNLNLCLHWSVSRLAFNWLVRVDLYTDPLVKVTWHQCPFESWKEELSHLKLTFTALLWLETKIFIFKGNERGAVQLCFPLLFSESYVFPHVSSVFWHFSSHEGYQERLSFGEMGYKMKLLFLWLCEITWTKWQCSFLTNILKLGFLPSHIVCFTQWDKQKKIGCCHFFFKLYMSLSFLIPQVRIGKESSDTLDCTR